MDRIADVLDTLVAGDAMSFSGVGLLAAIIMILALRLLLPRSELRKIRAPILFLLAHLLFVVLTAVTPADGVAHRTLYVAALFVLLLCLGRAGFLLLVDSILVRRLSRPIPKIFRDICEGLVYGAALLFTLRQAGAQLDALLTTSALLTAVVGLSLQDTLGNLFAGLSIQAQNPFEVGDWIQFNENPDMVGRVVEINWRATKVVTLDDVEVIMPNGPLARAPIRNFTKPTKVSRRSLYVVAPFSEPPLRVHEAILEGLAETDGVLRHPVPSVVTQEFTERGVNYWVRFFTDNFARREEIDGLARNRVWYAMRRAGIEIAVPVHDVDVTQDDESARQRARAEAVARREAWLGKVDFVRVLSKEQRGKLAVFARERPYAPGELVIRKGAQGDEFFIVQRGEVAIVLGEGDEEEEVARLDAGSFFGERSLMTGEPRTASVRTVRHSQLLVVDKDAFGQILAESPELAERISEVLADRREQLDSATTKSRTSRVVAHRMEERNELLHRIKEFFSLSS